jgi:hypothetical protein
VPMRTTPLVAVAGRGWALALQFAPDAVADRLCPEFPADRHWVARVLGVRLVAQHVTLLAAPRPPFTGAFAAVDALDAASMLPLMRHPRYRWAALASGGIAAATAAVLAAAAWSERRR